jgi:hypothetical protein
MEPVKKVSSVVVGAGGNKACINEMNVSVGNLSSKDYPAPKTSGIKIRGTGAATKGTTARGPMA